MIDTFIDYSVCTQSTLGTCTQQEIDNYYQANNIDINNLTDSEKL